MELGELLRAAGVAADLRGDRTVEIRDLAYDSRRVGDGTLFFCFAGEKTDGHDFAAAAVEAGAAALVVERPLELDVPQAQVEDARAAMALVAAAFNEDPTSELTVVGITGTNGKTTTAFLVLQRTFARMLETGDRACAMEVSSHALVLHRADAIDFAVKVFTNLSQDHLDFHADMEDYFAAKRLLFMGEGGAPLIEIEGGISVVNLDDPYGERLAGELSTGDGGDCITFSAAGGAADLSARGVTFGPSGSSFLCMSPDGQIEVQTPLPGDFNVANALAALSVAYVLGLDLRDAGAALASAEQVPGRFESIDEGQAFGVIVDYAHTPDSLENVLGAARRLTGGRLISVFGCGGDRDTEKRPLMGKAGAELSDIAVVTSDNPRSEDPESIIEMIRRGIPESPHAEVLVDVDRRGAIAAALGRAEKGDLVVIAGKGHEQGQEFENGRKIPFDDRDVARDELRKLAASAAG
jgi:UDP-N-acetylmuramoyl-L-alanyl-D-glutamate--2,6-diaminopimelate ligase